jgi:hypothetical protein
MVFTEKWGMSLMGIIVTLKLLENRYNIQKSAAISRISIKPQGSVGKMLFLYIFETALLNATLSFLLS